ncbi:MAG: OsmC family protein [Thermoflavifilum sp.]|nr:OsmC family protein [Thermoflavifilum sp.]MCL6513643.1 OsmC family protein [Alicyclobacillus sp.]
MKVTARWRGRRRFEAMGSWGQPVPMDAKADVGGEGQGHRPMELLLMGLVGCTGIDIAMILEKMRLPLDRLDIEAAGTRREEHPQAFTEIHVTYHVDGEIPPAKVWRAIHLSEQKYCSASASLKARIIPHLVLNGEEVPEDDRVEEATADPEL